MDDKTVVLIEEKEAVDGLLLTVHGQEFLLLTPGQSMDIVTHSGKHWYLSQVDGQSFV
mgnify:FL=1